MAVKHLIGRRGIGFSPGSVKYIITLGLTPSSAASGTGQTGSATIIGYGQQAAGIVGYAQQAIGIVGYEQQSATLESP